MEPASTEVRAIVAAERLKRVAPGRPRELRPRPRSARSTRVEQLEEPRRGEEIAAAVRQRRLGFGVRAPLLELPALVDADRVPRLLRRDRLLEHRQRRDQRAADRHQRRQAGEPEGIERRDGMRQPLDRRRRLRHVHHARRGREIDIVAPPRPGRAARPTLPPAARPARAARRRDSRRGPPRHSARAWPRTPAGPARPGRSPHWRGRSAASRAGRSSPRPRAIRRRSPRPAPRVGTISGRARRRSHRPAVEPDRPALAFRLDARRPSRSASLVRGGPARSHAFLSSRGAKHGVDHAEDRDDRADLRPAARPDAGRCR